MLAVLVVLAVLAVLVVLVVLAVPLSSAVADVRICNSLWKLASKRVSTDHPQNYFLDVSILSLNSETASSRRCYRRWMAVLVTSLRALSDEALIACVDECVADERRATARLLASIGELDVRRLYLPQGFSSLFAYCVGRLHLSEGAAYHRIEAARLARRFPIVLELVADSRVSLTAIAVLARHLNEQNHRALLTEATHKTVRQVEHIVARLAPQPDAPSVIRRLAAPAWVSEPGTTVPGLKLPAHPALTPGMSATSATSEATSEAATSSGLASAPEPAATSGLEYASGATAASGPGSAPGTAAASDPGSAPATRPTSALLPALPRTVIKAIAPERYKLQVTLSRSAHDKLRVAQNLLRHSTPGGDLGSVLERALDALLAHIEKTKLAIVARPRPIRPHSAPSTEHGGRDPDSHEVPPTSRHIPAAVRRAVWKRDAGRCAFMGAAGRCEARALLELHHVRPFAAGGEATVENIQLRCRAHNAHEAEIYFGSGKSR